MLLVTWCYVQETVQQARYMLLVIRCNRLQIVQQTSYMLLVSCSCLGLHSKFTCGSLHSVWLNLHVIWVHIYLPAVAFLISLVLIALSLCLHSIFICGTLCIQFDWAYMQDEFTFACLQLYSWFPWCLFRLVGLCWHMLPLSGLLLYSWLTLCCLHSVDIVGYPCARIAAWTLHAHGHSPSQEPNL